jgi:hypothetical protein
LSWLVAGWLCCQMAALLAAPMVLNAAGVTSHIGEETCDCPGAVPGQSCPMHPRGKTRESTSTCVVRNACPPTDAALISLIGGLGVLAAGLTLAADAPFCEEIPSRGDAAPARTELPESPPPRLQTL